MRGLKQVGRMVSIVHISEGQKVKTYWDGKHHSEETKAKISLANSGKHRTDEQIREMSERVYQYN